MYFPVTSRCSEADGSGFVNNQDLGISVLTESLFSFARDSQSTILSWKVDDEGKLMSGIVLLLRSIPS